QLGKLEAWHDGMVPWLHTYPEIMEAHTISQKTLRWPGFSNAVCTLHNLNLLTDSQISVEGIMLSPKQFLEHWYYDETRLIDDKNMSILLISAKGIACNQKKNIHLKLVSHGQEHLGLNSMALITGYTAAIIGTLI